MKAARFRFAAGRQAQARASAVVGLGLSVCLGLTLGLAAAQPLPAGWTARLAALLPLPAQSASIMERRSSLSMIELSMRVVNVGGDPAALKEVMASAARGVTPTYNERLGITRKEFQNYLAFQPTLAPARTLKLPVTRDAARLTFGDAPGLGGVLKGVSIDLRSGELSTPEGFSAKPVGVPAGSGNRDLDIRSGFQWKVIGNSPQSGNGVRGTLNLWQLGSGQVLLSYSRTSMIHNVTSSGEVILSYAR